jgi:hypothetical protein
MSNVEDWKKLVENVVSSPVRVAADNVFLALIREFAATLDKSPFMRAEVRQNPESKTHVLFVRPRYRKDMESPMLNFWITAQGVRVLGSPKDEMTTTEALTKFFVEFARDSTFPQTVQQCAEICNEDVSGTLWEKMGVWGPHDASVIVLAADQKRLSETAEQHPGAPFEVKVTLDTKNPLSKFSKTREYRYLESGGYGLQITSPVTPMKSAKDMLYVKGTVLTVTKLADAA